MRPAASKRDSAREAGFLDGLVSTVCGKLEVGRSRGGAGIARAVFNGGVEADLAVDPSLGGIRSQPRPSRPDFDPAGSLDAPPVLIAEGPEVALAGGLGRIREVAGLRELARTWVIPARKPGGFPARLFPEGRWMPMIFAGDRRIFHPKG